MFRKKTSSVFDSSSRAARCAKLERDVGQLISSPTDYPRAYVCNECIAMRAVTLGDVPRGTVTFNGTGVPTATLFEYLLEGKTLDDFLRSFPDVSRDEAISVLENARDSQV